MSSNFGWPIAFSGVVNATTANVDKLNLQDSNQNAIVGTATLAAGAVTIFTTAITANSKIFLTDHTPGGGQGTLSCTTRTPGVSFVITSNNGADTSTVDWLIIN